jgi:hypothetical protein
MAVIRSLQRVDPLPLSGVLVVVIIALMLVAVGLVMSANPVTIGSGNPFDVYATIMPGQPLSALEAFACGSNFNNDGGSSVFYCMIRPQDGPIRSISINSAYDKVESMTFRASDLRVGDLIEHWGHPDLTRVFDRSFTLAWDEGIYVIGSVQGRYNYWSKATYVLVMTPTH